MKGRILLVGLAMVGWATLSSQAVEASTSSATVKAAAYTISPAVTIAPKRSLAPGEQVSLTLTAYDGAAIDPHAVVWISFTSAWPNGHLAYGGASAFGTLTVDSTALKFAGNDNQYEYKVNAAGTLTMTFAAAMTPPPKAGFSDGIFVHATGGGKASPSNSMAYSQYIYSS